MIAAFYPIPTWIQLVVLGGACLLVGVLIYVAMRKR